MLEFVVDNEIAPIPPHIMKDQAMKTIKAQGPAEDRHRGPRLPAKLTDMYENMPGRKHD